MSYDRHPHYRYANSANSSNNYDREKCFPFSIISKRENSPQQKNEMVPEMLNTLVNATDLYANAMVTDVGICFSMKNVSLDSELHPPLALMHNQLHQQHQLQQLHHLPSPHHHYEQQMMMRNQIAYRNYYHSLPVEIYHSTTPQYPYEQQHQQQQLQNDETYRNQSPQSTTSSPSPNITPESYCSYNGLNRAYYEKYICQQSSPNALNLANGDDLGDFRMKIDDDETMNDVKFEVKSEGGVVVDSVENDFSRVSMKAEREKVLVAAPKKKWIRHYLNGNI